MNSIQCNSKEIKSTKNVDLKMYHVADLQCRERGGGWVGVEGCVPANCWVFPNPSHSPERKEGCVVVRGMKFVHRDIYLNL
jgi:hypothetical protein